MRTNTLHPFIGRLRASLSDAANNQQYRAVVNNGAGCADANSTPVTITTSAGACAANCAVLPGTILK